MKLFVGLGNPGAKYQKNRHNIGFMAVERIASEHGFGPWRAKFQGEVSEGELAGERVILLKPGTFMNLSGQSVGEALRYYKLAPQDVTVFHDELDLTPGKLRVKLGGGHAGHNGLRSIHQHIGADHVRVRLGIGHPGQKELVSHYVLQDFAISDAGWLEDLMRGIAEGAPWLVEGKDDRFLNAVAQRMNPPRSSRTAGAGHGAPKDAPKPAPAPGKEGPESQPPDTRNPLQKLMDKFR